MNLIKILNFDLKLTYYLHVQVEEKVKESLQIVLENVDDNWNLVYEDGDMKVTAWSVLFYLLISGQVFKPHTALHRLFFVTFTPLRNWFTSTAIWSVYVICEEEHEYVNISFGHGAEDPKQ